MAKRRDHGAIHDEGRIDRNSVLATDAAQEHRRRRAAIVVANRREGDHFRADGSKQAHTLHEGGADLDWRPFRRRRRRLDGRTGAALWSFGWNPRDHGKCSHLGELLPAASTDVLACSDCADDVPRPIQGAPMTMIEMPSIAAAEAPCRHKR